MSKGDLEVCADTPDKLSEGCGGCMQAAGVPASGLERAMPDNVALCAQPDSCIGYEDTLHGAVSLLARLSPDLAPTGGLGGRVFGRDRAGHDGDESDEEAIEALSEALGRVNGAS